MGNRDTRVTSIRFSPILSSRVILSDVSDIPLVPFAKPQIHRWMNDRRPLTALSRCRPGVVHYSPLKPLSLAKPVPLAGYAGENHGMPEAELCKRRNNAPRHSESDDDRENIARLLGSLIGQSGSKRRFSFAILTFKLCQASQRLWFFGCFVSTPIHKFASSRLCKLHRRNFFNCKI